MKDKHVDAAAPILIRFFVIFMIGLAVAGEIDTVIGLSIVICSVIVLVVRLVDDYRISRKQESIDKNVERHTKQMEEAMRRR